MADMYDSGLFTELGDLLGHDPTFYEESDVSSFSGDISKQSFNTFSLENTYVKHNPQVPEPLSSSPLQSDATEIDGLLSEGNMLLDKLMSDSGLDLLSAPVDLADVDELIATESKFNNTLNDTAPVSDLFAQFYEPSSEDYQQAPISPVSTLPSEPSSPVDLFNLDTALSPDPVVQPPAEAAADKDTENELETLLNSLLDDGASPSSENGDYYDSQLPLSPTDSSCSDYSVTAWEDNYSYSPAPQKAKNPKKKKSSTPYSKLPATRKEKKKQQNKEAAIRYRQKKKNECQVLADEEDQLLERNNSLKSEVLNLEREIMCMKELLSDVFNIHSI